MRNNRHWPGVAALGVTVLLVAGCGTTVQGAAGGTALTQPGGTDSAGTGQPGSAIAGSGNQAPASAELNHAGSSTTPGRAGPGQPGSLPAQGGSISNDASAAVPAGTSTSDVPLGILTWNEQSANSVIDAFGGSASIGDGQGAAKAVIAYINSHGGISGRKIAPVYAQFDPTSQQTFDQQRQANCATFTQDHHVFAVLDQVDASAQATIATCLAQHRTIYVESYMRDFLGQEMQRLAPYIYEPGDLADSGYRTAMDLLSSAKYFDPGYKLGVMFIDSPSGGHLYRSVIKTHLAQLGIKVTDEQPLPNPNAVSDAGALEQQISGAVLRFKTEGIDHVLGLSGGGLEYFMIQAEQQQYRPRYAMTSKEQAANLQTYAPAAQWHGALVTSWTPTADVSASLDPGGRPTRALCLKIFKDAGVDVPGRVAEHFMLVMCDNLFFVQAALEKAPAMTPAGMQAGVKALGASYLSAMTMRTQFGVGASAGANRLGLVAYDDSCKCLKYTKQFRLTDG